MKVLVLGANGMLGHKLVQLLRDSFDVYAAVRSDRCAFRDTGICKDENLLPEFDALNYEALESEIRTLDPEVVINAVGMIKHRADSKNAVLSIETNALFPHKLAEITRQKGARLISFSTDCVFKGDKGNYTEDDEPDAIDLYGKTKALGEVTGENCVTLRTSIIGRELSGSKSLLEWCLANRGGSIKGYAKAIYSGFTTIAMAGIVRRLISEFEGLEGLFHVSSAPINKYELLTLVNREFGLGISIARDEEFEIDRSLCSERFQTATGIIPPDWENMIQEAAEDQTPYEEWRKPRS